MMKETNISVALKERRNELNMTTGEVIAELKQRGINISEKTLYGWENGVSNPNVKAFINLCLIYGITDVYNFLGYNE